MDVGILLGLGSALGWGTSSFFAGVQARRIPALLVTVWSQLGGVLVLLTMLLLFGGAPTWSAIAWGMVAGLFGSTALMLFYYGMALGAVSIIAPIAACGAVVPVLWGLLQGDVPGVLAGAGIALAVLGIVLVSLQTGAAPDDARKQRSAILLAIGAALGFGMFFVFADIAGEVPGASPLWVAVGSRTGGMVLLVSAQLLRERTLPWPGRAILPLAVIGVIDTIGSVLYISAAQFGSIGVASVLSSLYPVVTVWLSQLFLAERLTKAQYGGVALALCGVVLLAAG